MIKPEDAGMAIAIMILINLFVMGLVFGFLVLMLHMAQWLSGAVLAGNLKVIFYFVAALLSINYGRVRFTFND